MEDYYALLEVDPKADAAEIRRAFRKAALRWHRMQCPLTPADRNENSPEATQKYQLLQEAYDCLKDPQERAWYDRHRIELLTGIRDRHGYTDLCDQVSLDDYFDEIGNVTLQFDFKRGSRNFYTVVADLFNAILRDEEIHVRAAAQAASQNPDRVVKERLGAPHFGNESTPWAQVSAWYTFWDSFQTSKAFAWADMYDPALGETRWERKQARIENKQARTREANKYNDRIQTLRRFVRERDPRVRQRRAETEAAETKRREEAEQRQKELVERRQEAKKQRRLAATAEMARTMQRAQEAGLSVEEFEAANGLGRVSATDVESLWKEDSRRNDDDELEPVPTDLAAAGCQKSGGAYKCRYCHMEMKTLGMFKTHMASRKHKQAAEKAGCKAPEPAPARKQQSGDDAQKQKARRRKEQPPTQAQQQAPSPTGASGPGAVRCKTCGQTFASRNKLFDHLKATGHAAYK